MEQSELALERPQAEKSSLMNVSEAVIYEQPLNELTRVCLRIEQLLAEADYNLHDPSPSGTHNTIAAIINLLHVLERPDLKAKLAKELSLQIQSLSRLENAKDIDSDKLKRLLNQLSDLNQTFIASNNKIAQSLREVEMLNSLKLHLATPGGGGSYDTPVYHYWLNLPAEHRQATLTHWLAEFNDIRLACHLLLKLLRKDSKRHAKTAVRGFYQELLDAQSNLRLIRVIVPVHIEAFPEISLSRHFMSVRFFTPTVNTRPAQLTSDLDFWLAYCTA